MKEIQTPFIVTQDNEFVPELSVLPPSPVEVALTHVGNAVGRFTGAVALQARMAVFDTLHGTNYRHIRNELVEQKRRENFEKSIGLVAIDRKH